jgi:hypothetical protein
MWDPGRGRFVGLPTGPLGYNPDCSLLDRMSPASISLLVVASHLAGFKIVGEWD